MVPLLEAWDGGTVTRSLSYGTLSVNLPFIKLKNELEQKFPGQLQFEGEGTPNVTGYFEVLIADTGKVLHSKKNGDGYVDSSAKMEKIVMGIQEALSKG
eukprot:gene2995-1254_t